MLPAASRVHLPAAYHELMTSEESEVHDFYPTTFQTDLNGKKQDWEAVVLIPFIDEVLFCLFNFFNIFFLNKKFLHIYTQKRLLSAMSECEDKLTNEERSRNIHGPMYLYEYSDKDGGPLIAGHGLGRCEHLNCTEQPIYRSEVRCNAMMAESILFSVAAAAGISSG